MWHIIIAYKIMMTSSNGNIFRVTGSLCGEFIGHRWILHANASDAELWCFLWCAPWINGWVNKCEAGDLRRHRAHCDVIVMCTSRIMHMVRIVLKQANNTKYQSTALLILCTGPAQRASNSNSASVAWRHHAMEQPVKVILWLLSRDLD